LNVAPPGKGKGSSADAAAKLVSLPGNAVALPLGSSEGFVKSFFAKNPDKEDAKKRPLIRHAGPVLVRADEIGSLIQQFGRQSSSGQGLIAQLKQMCSGEVLGHGYAADDKRLIVDALTYRASLVCGVAPAKAASLFDDLGGGLPERMVFAIATAERVPDDDRVCLIPCDPGPLGWETPYVPTPSNAIVVDDDVARVIRLADLAQKRETYKGSELDVHRTYNTLRLAVPVAWLHGEQAVSMRWWEMAEQIMVTSDATRAWLRVLIDGEQAKLDDAAGRRHASKTAKGTAASIEVEEAYKTKRTEAAARKIWQLVSDDRAETLSQSKRLMRSFDADQIDAGLGHALDLDWLVETEKGTTPGGSKKRLLTVGKSSPS
jgi:hypothetical protein